MHTMTEATPEEKELYEQVVALRVALRILKADVVSLNSFVSRIVKHGTGDKYILRYATRYTELCKDNDINE